MMIPGALRAPEVLKHIGHTVFWGLKSPGALRAPEVRNIRGMTHVGMTERNDPTLLRSLIYCHPSNILCPIGGTRKCLHGRSLQQNPLL